MRIQGREDCLTSAISTPPPRRGDLATLGGRSTGRARIRRRTRSPHALRYTGLNCPWLPKCELKRWACNGLGPAATRWRITQAEHQQDVGADCAT